MRRKVFTHSMTRKRQRWQPFQAAAGGDLERRKVFTHAMTRKRQRWQPPRAAAAGRRQRRRRAHEKNQRKCVMSGVEGALSTRTPRPRWPPPQGGHPAAGRPHVAAAGRPQAVAAGRPQGGRRRTATAGRPQAATAGRPQAAAVRAAAGRAWATRTACLLPRGETEKARRVWGNETRSGRTG